MNTPILVTGAHRTGTTWVGKMLAASGQAAYISEPLNVLHRPGVLRIPIQHWYTYICPENEAGYLPAFLEMLNFNYHLGSEIRSLRSRKDILRMGRDARTFWLARLSAFSAGSRQRPLLKDPFALFSIPWFIQRLNCQVVVTVRHPAAFASSLKRLNWPFHFQDLLDQPLLMRDWIEPFRAEIEDLVEEEKRTASNDILAQGSLLWRIAYSVLAQFKNLFPQIQVVRHEDLSLDPANGYQALYAALGLDFNQQAQKTILESSSSDNPSEASSQNVYAVRLDSRAALHNWKKRMNPQEIQRVRQLTEDVASLYYPDLNWD